MKAKIAAWLISLAMTINGGPIEPMETEPTSTVPETKEIEIVEIETKEIETKGIEIIPAMENTWEIVTTTWDTVSDKMTFWD